MLNIRCSTLEQVRNNPVLFAQSLIEDIKTTASFGMFGYWQSAIRQMHIDSLSVSETIKNLQNSFLRFKDTPVNRARQEHLIRSLVAYEKEFRKYKFEFKEGAHRIKWDIHTEVRLTGNTPWILSNGEEFYSFIPIEMNIYWRDQLRFPLLQNYIASEILDCEIQNLSMGVFNLNSNKFEFKCYTDSEIEDSIYETGGIFQRIYEEYSRGR